MNNSKDIFKHPFTMCVSGSTGSGKTEWIMHFLKELANLCESWSPAKGMLLYCYGELNANILRLQQCHQQVKNHTPYPFGQIRTHNGLPPLELVKTLAMQTGGHLLVVLDDLMIGAKQEFLDILFTRGSHNWGLSVVLVTQHLFAKEIRTARANSHYLVLMRNPAGALQIQNLAVQIFPRKVGHFMEAYADATSHKFGYLLVDLHPKSEVDERLMTNIFPHQYTIYYVPNDGSATKSIQI